MQGYPPCAKEVASEVNPHFFCVFFIIMDREFRRGEKEIDIFLGLNLVL